MNLYLAGPMRGYALNNFPMFDCTAEALRRAGHTVSNPADHDRELGLSEFSDGESDPAIFHEMFRWDLSRVMESDGVVFLPGWQKSKGACAERTVAHYLGIKCYDVCSDGQLIEQITYHEPQISWLPKL